MFSYLKSDEGRLLAPLLVSILLGLLSAALTWLKDLGRTARRLKTLDEAKRRLDFWEQAKRAAWVDASPFGEQVKKAADADYLRVLTLVKRALAEWPPPGKWNREEYLSYLGQVKRVSRFFLVYRQMTYTNLWFRALFYGSLSASVFIVMESMYLAHQYTSIASDHSFDVVIRKGVAELLFMGLTMRLLVWQEERMALKSEDSWEAEMGHREDPAATWRTSGQDGQT